MPSPFPSSPISTPGNTGRVRLLVFNPSGTGGTPLDSLVRNVDAVATSELGAARAALLSQPFDALLGYWSEQHESVEELLKTAQRLRPEALRIAVVAETERAEHLARRLAFVHQFVRDREDKIALVLNRSLRVHATMTHNATRRLVLSGNDLPTPSETYLRLLDQLSRPDVSVLKITAIIEQDLALTARLTQFASSAFFGLPRQISSIGGCIAYLGLETVRALVLAAEVAQTFRLSHTSPFSLESIQAQAFGTARIAKRIGESFGWAEDAFIAGLFSNVGHLILASRAPERLKASLDLAERDGIPLWQAELREAGTHHALAGAYLLAAWGLPLEVVEGVMYSERPREGNYNTMSIACAVHVAARLAQDPQGSGAAAVQGDEIDLPLLEEMGAIEALSGWRAWARSSLPPKAQHSR